MAITVSHEESDNLLRREWEYVQEDKKDEYLQDSELREKIEEVIYETSYGGQTFKYMLLTNLLAKAVNPDVHYRALRERSNLDVSFDSRTLANEITSDWDKDVGQRLGGSNEPGTSRPYREDEIDSNYDANLSSTFNALYEVLEDLEGKTGEGEIEPITPLRQALQEIRQLPKKTTNYENPSEVPYRRLKPILDRYLRVSGGGERLAAIVAATIQTYYTHNGREDWSVSADHVNVPDEQTNAAGDVEVFDESGEEELERAFEVKDKPARKSDIQHSITKARENKLGEYIFVTGDGFHNGEKEAATEVIKDAPIELILITDSEMLQILKLVGDKGRGDFTKAVGSFLNEMRASERNKSDWEDLIEELND